MTRRTVKPYPGTLTVWQGGKQLTGHEADVVLIQRHLALAAMHPAPAALPAPTKKAG